MIQLSEEEKQIPAIESEEDAPFLDQSNNIPSATKEELKEITSSMEDKKFSLGSNILGWCLGIMLVLVILSMFQHDNTLINNAFDAFKLIVMTILGYIFGSNTKQ